MKILNNQLILLNYKLMNNKIDVKILFMDRHVVVNIGFKRALFLKITKCGYSLKNII